jgi:hypothetical protein
MVTKREQANPSEESVINVDRILYVLTLEYQNLNAKIGEKFDQFAPVSFAFVSSRSV